jgi:hypothetical protein
MRDTKKRGVPRIGKNEDAMGPREDTRNCIVDEDLACPPPRAMTAPDRAPLRAGRDAWLGAGGGRVNFAHSFVIAFAPHPHVRKMCTPVRAERDFALCIKIPSGLRADGQR